MAAGERLRASAVSRSGGWGAATLLELGGSLAMSSSGMAVHKYPPIRLVQMCVSRPTRILAELFAEFGSFKLEQKNGDASCGY